MGGAYSFIKRGMTAVNEVKDVMTSSKLYKIGSPVDSCVSALYDGYKVVEAVISGDVKNALLYAWDIGTTVVPMVVGLVNPVISYVVKAGMWGLGKLLQWCFE